MIKKIKKSLSGIVSITTLTAPNFETAEGKKAFSCKYNCHMCPNEPGQPRSYLHDEPGVLRANNNNFIATDQFWDRCSTLHNMGHITDKVELLILGGTITSYPKAYIREFVRDLYYAANTFPQKLNGLELRSKLSLEEEKNINQNESFVKIIGLTVETRPDQINKETLEFFRELGVTRVQLGLQHTSDIILDKINRMCKNFHIINAIKLLLDCGFKVDIHIMPDLPGSSPEIDLQMFIEIINSDKYQVDQWKIYPCKVTPYTVIEQWYKDGTYKPYSEQFNPDGTNLLTEMLLKIMAMIPPWIRVNRIERDIPSQYILGGMDNTSYRNDLDECLRVRGLKSNDIRAREIGSKYVNIADYKIIVRIYNASEGIEHFISWENDKNDLLGFLRLRFPSKSESDKFPELNDCALIRELHIYGKAIHHRDKNTGEGVQHKGLGKELINKAKEISLKNKKYKLSVISGVGVRNYYIKLGFESADTYIDKNNIQQIAKGGYLIANIKEKSYLHIISSIMIVIIAIMLYFIY